MAKVGLNFGEKVPFADKQYRVLNEGIVDPKDILGDLRLIEVVGDDHIMMDDTTQPRRQDGTYPQIPTGETRGVNISVSSSGLKEAINILVVDMTAARFPELGIKYNDFIDLNDIYFAYVSVGKRSDRIKLLATDIHKLDSKPTTQSKPDAKKAEAMK